MVLTWHPIMLMRLQSGESRELQLIGELQAIFRFNKEHGAINSLQELQDMRFREALKTWCLELRVMAKHPSSLNLLRIS